MGLISHKQIKAFRSYILSPRLELVLLLIYIVCFAMIVNLKITSKNGRSLGNPINLSAYEYHRFLEKQMLKSDFDNISSLQDYYAWLEKVQTERLWVEGGIRSANWPIGATRIVQHRIIKRPRNCSSFPRPEGVPKQEPEACYKYYGTSIDGEKGRQHLECLKLIYQQQCNQMFSTAQNMNDENEEGKDEKTDDYAVFKEKTVQCLKSSDYQKQLFTVGDKNKDDHLDEAELSTGNDGFKVFKWMKSELKKSSNSAIKVQKDDYNKYFQDYVAQMDDALVDDQICDGDIDAFEKLVIDDSKSSYQFTDRTYCINDNKCNEYSYSRDADIGQFFGTYAIYFPEGFLVDLNSDNERTKNLIKSLKKQNWIDQDTRAIQTVLTVKSYQSLTFFTIRAVLEMPNGPLQDNVMKSSFIIQNLVLHENHNTQESSSDTQDIILHILILLHFLLYTIKILFELSLGISRITNFLELGNLGAMFFIVVLRMIDFVLQQNLPSQDIYDSNKFISFQKYIIIEQMYTYCLAICSFFYPFRIYQYLAHYPFFNPCVIVMNTFSRTAPGIFVYFFLIIILVLSFSMGVHVILGYQFDDFATYEKTIFAIIAADFPLIRVYHDLKKGYSAEKFDLQIVQFLIVIFRLFVLIFGCALVTNLYKKAMGFEKGHSAMDPEKKGFYDTVEEIGTQIQELYKDMTNQSQHHSDRFENQKIVAWLLNRSKESQSSERQQFFDNLNEELKNEHVFYGAAGQINKEQNTNAQAETETEEKETVDLEGVNLVEQEGSELAGLTLNKQATALKAKKMDKDQTANKIVPSSDEDCMSITPIEFETPYWLVEFLQSLFQLKPDLKTSVTYKKFRIVIEFFGGSRGESRFDICAIEYVIDHLRFVGCKVPVLIYSDINIGNDKYQKIMQLKKNYLMLFFTNDIREVRKFCKMDHMRDKYSGQKY